LERTQKFKFMQDPGSTNALEWTATRLGLPIGETSKLATEIRIAVGPTMANRLSEVAWFKLIQIKLNAQGSDFDAAHYRALAWNRFRKQILGVFVGGTTVGMLISRIIFGSSFLNSALFAAGLGFVSVTYGWQEWACELRLRLYLADSADASKN
jgi:hypothetical protein